MIIFVNEKKYLKKVILNRIFSFDYYIFIIFKIK